MPTLDANRREKWPAPHNPPAEEDIRSEVEQALGEQEEPLRAKARAVLALLRGEYGEPEWPVLDPLGTLVEILLSHRTADPATWKAFTTLRERFPTWEQVCDAPVPEIEEAIDGVTWPEQKAPRIKAVLERIKGERGNLDLSFLDDLPLEEANAWLQSLGGVGPKTAACVLLFSMKRPLLPVDTHVHRVSIRLGLIPEKMSADAAHPAVQAFLPDPNDERDVLAFHRNMLLHGQRVCVWRDPHCQRCVVREWCDYYATHPEKWTDGSDSKSRARTGKGKSG
jgi:endonuclease III